MFTNTQAINSAFTACARKPCAMQSILYQLIGYASYLCNIRVRSLQAPVCEHMIHCPLKLPMILIWHHYTREQITDDVLK